ncbi:hypothetical protein EV421DRAFT_1728674 [Armillaria borealis]|uniref:Uncharacterized protein n=1 Tax=Armillaria borealis TaxID=47425 RepID=A0AA39K9Q1_9AGAR|nr:hypothetical protein EV421DRAFT_1728674 [Armillaria borealis]
MSPMPTYCPDLPLISDQMDQMDQCVLPQEILDAVVDSLKDNKAALKACSLISRRLTLRTRVHLFYTIRPRMYEWNDGMLDLLQSSPSLIAHIRRIFLSPLGIYDSALAAIIELLVNPIHLEMYRVDWISLPEHFVQALYSRTYASVNLCDTRFSSFSELASLLANSTRLEKLAIRKLIGRFEPVDDPGPSRCTHQHPSPGPPVDHLVLFDHDSSLYHLLNGINSWQCPVSIQELKTLEIHSRGWDHFSQFQALLGGATKLEELTFRHSVSALVPLATSSPLPISHLKKLTVNMPQYHSGNTQPIDWWISNFENTDGNCLLKDIHFCVQAAQDDYLHYVQHNPEHEAVWDGVAHALSKSRMPALRSLKVEVSIDRSAGVSWERPVPPSSACNSMNDCIEAKLATLESRGVTVQVIVKTPGWSRRLDNMANVTIS